VNNFVVPSLTTDPTLQDPLPDSFVPHNIKIDRRAEILCDSNCCVQVDDYMPPSTRDKHCFTRAVQDLQLKNTNMKQITTVTMKLKCFEFNSIKPGLS